MPHVKHRGVTFGICGGYLRRARGREDSAVDYSCDRSVIDLDKLSSCNRMFEVWELCLLFLIVRSNSGYSTSNHSF